MNNSLALNNFYTAPVAALFLSRSFYNSFPYTEIKNLEDYCNVFDTWNIPSYSSVPFDSSVLIESNYLDLAEKQGLQLYKRLYGIDFKKKYSDFFNELGFLKNDRTVSVSFTNESVRVRVKKEKWHFIIDYDFDCDDDSPVFITKEYLNDGSLKIVNCDLADIMMEFYKLSEVGSLIVDEISTRIVA